MRLLPCFLSERQDNLRKGTREVKKYTASDVYFFNNILLPVNLFNLSFLALSYSGEGTINEGKKEDKKGAWENVDFNLINRLGNLNATKWKIAQNWILISHIPQTIKSAWKQWQCEKLFTILRPRGFSITQHILSLRSGIL